MPPRTPAGTRYASRENELAPPSSPPAGPPAASLTWQEALLSLLERVHGLEDRVAALENEKP